MIFDLIKNGLVLGSVYLLFSAGFTLVFGAFNVLNLAHGAIMTLGAFIGIYVDNVLGLPVGVSLLAAALGGGAVNAFMDVALLRPIVRSARTDAGSQDLIPIVVTLSFGAILIGLLVQTVKAVDFTYKKAEFLARPLSIGGITISSLAIAIIVSAVTLTGLLYIVIHKTRAGMAVRAVAEDRLMASALGIRPDSVSAAIFFVSGALAAICGVLVGILYSNVGVGLGDQLLLFGFVIITIGGVGSLAGTAVAALFVGMLQTVANNYFQSFVVDLIVFAALLLTLLVRPSGMFGKAVLSAGIARQ